MNRAEIFDMVIDRHTKRGKKAFIADRSKKAKRTFSIKNKKGVELWMKNPNRYDIGGIDTPTSEWEKWHKETQKSLKLSSKLDKIKYQSTEKLK